MMLSIWLRRLAGSAVAFVAALGLLFAAPAHADDAYVTVKDNAYAPQRVEVTAGDSVVWSWSDSNSNRHTVSALDGRFDSHPECSGALDGCGDQQRGAFAVTFDEPGTYRYVCKVHSVTMTGSVVVSAPSDEGSERESEPAVPDLLAPSESDSPAPADDTDDSGDSGDSDDRDDDGQSRNAEQPDSTQDGDASDSDSRSSVRSASSARVMPARNTSATSARAHFPSLDIMSRQIPVHDTGQEPVIAPEVAAPEVAPPSESADPQETSSELDDLAVEIPTGDSGLPAPVVGIGIATLAAAGAGFTKFVLLKRPVG